MWLHIVIFAGVLLLGVGAWTGRIPYERYVDKKEFRKILLLVLAGNLLGTCLTWQNNQSRTLQELVLDRPAYGQGDGNVSFQVHSEDGTVEVSVDIPQQAGEEETESETAENLSSEEAFVRKIREEVAALNEEKADAEHYYLPAQVDGKALTWVYPQDYSGNVLGALTLFAGLLLFARREQNREERRRKRREEMLMEYPNLVTKLCLLMEAGLTMRRAFAKTALDYKKYRERDAPRKEVYEEMLAAYYEMESGVLEAQAYENFGKRCDQAQYRTLATLLVQNMRRGSRGLVDLLEKEALLAFEDRKRQAKIRGEAATTKLLFPMLLMLMVVLVILMVPAFMSFTV